MREKDFEKQVKEYLKESGCWFLKTWSNGVQREGVPDLLVCCNGYFLGVELKAANGHPSELQLKNIQWIRKAYGIAIVLYPNQFEEFKELIHDMNEMMHYTAFNKQKRFDKEEYFT
jgi:Holliday junction resolvase